MKMRKKSHFIYITGDSNTLVSVAPAQVLLLHEKRYSERTILEEPEILPEEYSLFPATSVRLRRYRHQQKN